MNLGPLSQKSWSPYLAGMGLGLLAAASLVFFGRPLAASGAYQNLASYLGHALSPESVYFTTVRPASFGWPEIVLLGVFLGALASALISGTFRLRFLPDEGWEEAWGSRRATRFALVFVGAFLIEIGAAIAGGCTSGLAISGGVVLAPGAFVFMAAMFAAGIPTALLVARHARARARRGGRS